MRFSDYRLTLIKRQPVPEALERKPDSATPRRIAPPKLHPDNLQPAYNRASRRAQGQYRTQRRAGLHRAFRRAQRRPLPWKPPVEPMPVADG
jgi:hypothetical protein